MTYQTKPTISVIMTTFNRNVQLYRTLRTIERSTVQDVEIIVVDDGGTEEERFDDLAMYRWRFPIRLTRLHTGKKTWVNPCVAFNIGIAQARGTVILIQNAECLHCGDVLRYALDNVDHNSFLSFSCYGINQETTQRLNDISFSARSPDLLNQISQSIGAPLYAPTTDASINGWLNHPTIKPKFYHYAAALTRDGMARVGAFDWQFADGFCFDDDDFLLRINAAGLTMSIVPAERGYVLHQWHPAPMQEMIDSNYPRYLELHTLNKHRHEQNKLNLRGKI